MSTHSRLEGLWMRVAPSQGTGQARRWYLCFLGDIQHQLELLRHGQIFLCGFLQSKGRENFPLEFNSSEKLLTTRHEDSQPQGSVGPCCQYSRGTGCTRICWAQDRVSPCACCPAPVKGVAGCGVPQGKHTQCWAKALTHPPSSLQWYILSKPPPFTP